MSFLKARRLFALASALAFLLTPEIGFAQDATVALAKIKGPRKSGATKLTRGVVAGLAGKGILVVYGGELSDAAKSAGVKQNSVDAARAAEAQYLLSVQITRSRRKFFATARLTLVSSGDQLKTIKKSYRRAKSSTKIGRAIGAGMAATIKSQASAAPVVAEADPIENDPLPVAPVKKTKKKTTRIRSDDASSVSASVGGSASAGGGEDKLLHLRLGAGTQALSAYTVAVGGAVTGLAYTLSPLMLVNAGVGFTIPDVGAGLELDLSFVPVKYAIDVEPAVSPAEPTGRFFNFGAMAFYNLELARFGKEEQGRFILKPMLGLAYNSMTVESQGENTVVVSWSSFNLEAGARANVRVDEQLSFNLNVRAGLVVGYSEGPTTTGEGGGGLAFRVGGEGRYWLSDAFGIFIDTQYSYMRVGLDGIGTRTPFVDDPPLEGATIFSGDLKLGTGVLLAI